MKSDAGAGCCIYRGPARERRDDRPPIVPALMRRATSAFILAALTVAALHAGPVPAPDAVRLEHGSTRFH